MITYLFMVEVLSTEPEMETPEVKTGIFFADVQAENYELAVEQVKEVFNISNDTYHQGVSSIVCTGEYAE